jgi:CBS domain-containing protein
MNNEGLSSVAVVDNGYNVVGNISTADVRLLTNAASLPLLKNTSMHFISVILGERGVEKGRDSFPVFYVTPNSTLAHTVAKLVATNSHRMWVVEAPSPSPSGPPTPLLTPRLSHSSTSVAGSTSATATSTGPGTGTNPETTPTIIIPNPGEASGSQAPTPVQGFPPVSVPAASMPGAHLSGRLTGVVSLTDILNLIAKSSGLSPADPTQQRDRRRRSSSSSIRPSLEGGRQSSSDATRR